MPVSETLLPKAPAQAVFFSTLVGFLRDHLGVGMEPLAQRKCVLCFPIQLDKDSQSQKIKMSPEALTKQSVVYANTTKFSLFQRGEPSVGMFLEASGI